jgi:hypothetical protein
MASITGEKGTSYPSTEATGDKPSPATEATPATGEKESFVVQIVEE